MGGGGNTQSSTVQRYNAIQVGASAYGGCVPLVYGRQRVPFTLTWYGNFKNQKVSQGGKGGGGGKGGQSFTYSASFTAALCEGPLYTMETIWSDKDTTTLAKLGFTLFPGYTNGTFSGAPSSGSTTATISSFPLAAPANWNIVFSDGESRFCAVTAGGVCTWSVGLTNNCTTAALIQGQNPWNYLQTNYPTQAIPYDHIVYIGTQSHGLGSSATIPNITFEVRALLPQSGTPWSTVSGIGVGDMSATLTPAWAGTTGLWSVTFSDFEVIMCNLTNGSTAITFTTPCILGAGTGIYIGPHNDADPASIIYDYLTDPNHGVGFPVASVGTLTGANSYQSYCASLGLFLSPMETTQRAASDFIKEILQITNSDAVWSAGVLKILPYSDVAVAGNGTSFTPNLTPQFIFTDDDFLEPPELTRKPITDTFNHIRVEYLDRADMYNTQIVEATDLGNIALTGERVQSTLNFHEITSASVALTAGQLALQTSLYERNTIKFKVRADYCLLEPMDYIGITDTGLGYINQVFRVTKVTDDDKDELDIEALEVAGTVRSSAIYNWGPSQGYTENWGADGGVVQTPVFMEAYSTLVSSGGGRQLWIGVCGPSGSVNWGGCDAYASLDNVTYQYIGTVATGASYGTITSNLSAVADPDTTSTLNVTLNNTISVLDSGTHAEADDDRLLIAVGSGANIEIISYATATLVTSGVYNLTYMRRGQYWTTDASHSIGAQFIRLDGNLLQLAIEPAWIGQTMYFKFCSFNVHGRGTQDIATVTAYSYVPSLSAVAYDSATQSGFAATGTAVMFSLTTAFKQAAGAAAWDSSVYATEAFTNGCSAVLYPSQVNDYLAFGLTTNPTSSPSYSNLAYGWYLNNNGTCQVLIGGSNYTSFNYTATSMLAIQHDGKHVSWYINGVLVFSSPQQSATYYMEVCFYTPGAAVYGLVFDNVASAVTPYTLKPLTNNVACAGTRAIANGAGSNNVWGSRAFTSIESFNEGCQVSAQMSPLGYAVVIGLAMNTASGDTTGVAIMTAGWLLDPAATKCWILYNGGTVDPGSPYNATPVAGDVFTTTYDGFWFRWYRNGLVAYQAGNASAANLYLFGDLYTYGDGLQNITFEPFSSATPNPFIGGPNGYVTVHDSTALRVAGTSAWDGFIYSLNGYTSCHVQGKFNPINLYSMIGLSTNPALATGSSVYSYANYAIENVAGGRYDIYESGTSVVTGAGGLTPNATDLVAIIYSSTAGVVYLVNGQVLRTVVVSGLTLYAFCPFYSSGAGQNLLAFGPGTALDTIGTASLDANAATTVLSSNVASTVIGSNGIPNTNAVLVGSLTVTPLNFGFDVVTTFSGSFDFNQINAGAGAEAYIMADASTHTTISANDVLISGVTGSAARTVQAFSREWRYNYPSGSPTSITFYFYGGCNGINTVNGTATLINVVIKVEVIKR